MKILSVSNRVGLRITIIYLVIAGCWIFFSDRFLLSIIDDTVFLAKMQTYKGLFYVLVTGGLLYYLINKNTASIERSRQRIEETLQQKQVLMGELHHRVKNNLAIISGLIELQAEELSGESQQLLKTTRYRIHSLAEIQELLFREENLTSIPFHEFLDHLVQTIKGADKQYSVQATFDELILNVNQAIPLGLLINEMFSQAKLNGFQDQDFSIDFSLTHKQGNSVRIHFTFSNLPEEASRKLRNSDRHLEATLIRLYAQQLRATTDWLERDGELNFDLKFEKSDRPGASSGLKMSRAS